MSWLQAPTKHIRVRLSRRLLRWTATSSQEPGWRLSGRSRGDVRRRVLPSLQARHPDTNLGVVIE